MFLGKITLIKNALFRQFSVDAKTSEWKSDEEQGLYTVSVYKLFIHYKEKKEKLYSEETWWIPS